MQSLRVIHYRDRDRIAPDERLVYIGRQNGRYHLPASPLGNPYRVSEYGDAALALYTQWLSTDSAAHAELERLVGLLRAGNRLVLACWCKPKPCHGDIVVAALNQVLFTTG